MYSYDGVCGIVRGIIDIHIGGGLWAVVRELWGIHRSPYELFIPQPSPYGCMNAPILSYQEHFLSSPQIPL